ncbi:MAG: sugar-binding transcriptional regulator [Granulosicoccus sp.]|nr:sugar-binding transcriptional regulator [Granulosicoccus sp.]
MSRLNELRLIARVAQMYYTEGQRQANIASHLCISQASVSRMLKKAQSENIVRTTVASPPGTYTELETALRKAYDLSEVIVVECSENREGPIMARIGEAAAHVIETTLQPDEIIGVSSWSETILKMVENIHPMKTGKAKYVVQTLGGMGDPAVQIHATQLTSQLAKLTGGKPMLLNAPGLAQSREAKLVLMGDSYIRETVELFEKVTLGIVGIGALEPSNMLARSGNVFTSRELRGIEAVGAVGDISLRFFDKDGGPVKTPLDERVIGVSLEELTQVKRVIGLAGGHSKIAAISGALRSNVIDLFITDKFTAAHLLEQ